MRRSIQTKKQSIDQKLWSMSLALLVPMCVMCILLFLLFLSFSIQYEKEIRNITTVSTFNQNFPWMKLPRQKHWRRPCRQAPETKTAGRRSTAC